MARFLGLPERVTSATPTTDTYSLAQGQDEFYFALPYAQMDLALWALNHDRPVGELAAALGATQAQAQAVHDDIRAKCPTTHRNSTPLNSTPPCAPRMPSPASNTHPPPLQPNTQPP